MTGLDICIDYIGLDRLTDRDKIIKLLKLYSIDDDIVLDPSNMAWCAAWMNMCERAIGNKGTGHINAKSFLDYGTEIPISVAQYGDILIFHFSFDDAYQGHVSYLVE